jgi:hypothetical protein
MKYPYHEVRIPFSSNIIKYPAYPTFIDECEGWLNENVGEECLKSFTDFLDCERDTWFLTSEMTDRHGRYCSIFFKKTDHALLFKLTWGGNSV